MLLLLLLLEEKPRDGDFSDDESTLWSVCELNDLNLVDDLPAVDRLVDNNMLSLMNINVCAYIYIYLDAILLCATMYLRLYRLFELF